MKVLRDYQQDAVTKIKSRLQSVTHPILIKASVGAGKSLIIAEILKWIESSTYKVLCLTANSTLIEQNAETYRLQGGEAGIYCSSLNKKDINQSIIFASPNSVSIDISNHNLFESDDCNPTISKVKFNLIVIDECHNIDYNNNNTMYMRIIHHYGLMAQAEQYNFRIIGLTGTAYRGKNISIVGEHQLFKESVTNISTGWLIERGYLVPPEFGLCSSDSYDFSKLKINSLGKFKNKDLEHICNDERLTGEIIREVVEIMKNHVGAFIFASTRRHCAEIVKNLPDGEWAVITGDIKHDIRKEILDKAKQGKLKYLVSVNCLGVGVDVPPFDVIVWLRPTESLIIYTQGIGRVLRLSEGKTRAIVLDYAGNLQRHGNIDDPIINQALKPTLENEKQYIIPCGLCETFNTIGARRCIGVHEDQRCNHYFEWKDCPDCLQQNDLTARYCAHCKNELIDPNNKLSKESAKDERFLFEIKEGKYWVLQGNHFPSFQIKYTTTQGLYLYESYAIKEGMCINIFYGKFLKKCVWNASVYYPKLKLHSCLNEIITNGDIQTPNQVECVYKDNRYIIKERFFENPI